MINILRGRRSVRKFQRREIEPEKVQFLQEALLRSPSSRGINPWELIFVDDHDTLQALGRSREHGSRFLAGAALAVVVLGDTDRSDTVIEDCSIAAITLQYTAESIGLKSCWCQIRMRQHGGGKPAGEYVRNLLGIPARHMVECIVGIGYPAESKSPHPGGELDRIKIHRGKW